LNLTNLSQVCPKLVPDFLGTGKLLLLKELAAASGAFCLIFKKTFSNAIGRPI